MNSTVAFKAIATTSSTCNRLTVQTPQRKARYHDNFRTRLVRVKEAALKQLGLSCSQDVRLLLKELKIHLDLRMTSAWCAIAKELMPHLLKLLEQKKFVSGVLVTIKDCPANLYFWMPFRIASVESGMAQLEYVANLFPLDRLELWQENAIAA